MANFNSKNVMLIGLKGEDAMINQDLTAAGFTPVANNYYRHAGETTSNFKYGVIYFYDGTDYNAIVDKSQMEEAIENAITTTINTEV